MTKQTTGWALIGLAAGMFLYNISGTIADLRDWHALSSPQIVGAILQQFGAVVTAAIGGTLLPQPGAPKE